MQPSRNFDDLKFSSIHRRILLWGSGGPFLDGYVLVMIGVALEQLTPALKLDADWIGLLGAGTLAGLFVGPAFTDQAIQHTGQCSQVDRQYLFQFNRSNTRRAADRAEHLKLCRGNIQRRQILVKQAIFLLINHMD